MFLTCLWKNMTVNLQRLKLFSSKEWLPLHLEVEGQVQLWVSYMERVLLFIEASQTYFISPGHCCK